MDSIQAHSSEEFVRTATTFISDILREATAHGQKATVGLAGGSTPAPVYMMLSADTSIPWERITFFLTDERYIPTDHLDSNTRMIQQKITQVGNLSTFLTPDVTLPLEKCIQDYDLKLQNIEPDLVILGMGPDGHIASLFPPLPLDAHGPATVIHTTTTHFAVRDRISVTLPLLHRAKKRVLLITGNEKRALFQKIQEQSLETQTLPAAALPRQDTTWILG